MVSNRINLCEMTRLSKGSFSMSSWVVYIFVVVSDSDLFLTVFGRAPGHCPCLSDREECGLNGVPFLSISLYLSRCDLIWNWLIWENRFIVFCNVVNQLYKRCAICNHVIHTHSNATFTCTDRCQSFLRFWYVACNNSPWCGLVFVENVVLRTWVHSHLVNVISLSVCYEFMTTGYLCSIVYLVCMN